MYIRKTISIQNVGYLTLKSFNYIKKTNTYTKDLFKRSTELKKKFSGVKQDQMELDILELLDTLAITDVYFF